MCESHGKKYSWGTYFEHFFEEVYRGNIYFRIMWLLTIGMSYKISSAIFLKDIMSPTKVVKNH